MQSINIYEKGISYLSAVMSVYMENCAYFLIYLAGLIYILIKGDDKEKEMFLPSGILMFLTIYNPIVPLLLNKFFDVNSEYYRLFWIAPVIILCGYIAAKLIGADADITAAGITSAENRALSGENHTNKNERIIICVLICLIALTAGNFVYSKGYNKIENIYQMPDELIEISEIIHEDSTAEYPKAFLEYEYNMQMRQYDAKMQLTIDREDYLRGVRESFPQDMIEDDEHPQYRILAALLRGQYVDGTLFEEALEATKTEYIVLSKGNDQSELFDGLDIKLIAETDNHEIYKYNVKEPYIYELIDYSDVEHKFSFRRLK